MPKQNRALKILPQMNNRQKMLCVRTVGVQQSFFVVQFGRWASRALERMVQLWKWIIKRFNRWQKTR